MSERLSQQRGEVFRAAMLAAGLPVDRYFDKPDDGEVTLYTFSRDPGRWSYLVLCDEVDEEGVCAILAFEDRSGPPPRPGFIPVDPSDVAGIVEKMRAWVEVKR